MEDKQEIINQIKELLNKYDSIFKSYNVLFVEIVFPNIEKIKEWFPQVLQNPSIEDFNNKLDLAQKNVDLIPQLLKENDNLHESVQSGASVSLTYLQLVRNELNTEPQINDFAQWIKIISDSWNQLRETESNLQAKRSVVNTVNALVSNTVFANHYIKKMAHLRAFDYFKDNDKNIVIIGANGSGKSSFARNTRAVLGKNVAIIAAQKIFSFHKITSVSLDKSSIKNVWTFQQDDKLYKDNNFSGKIGGDLQNLIQSLIEEQNDCAHKFFNSYQANESIKRPITILERVMLIWQEILPHRTLKYEKGDILVYPPHGSSYPFMNLSDGEKAVFYYVAHVLLAKENSFIIVDEPENHLHLALVSRLWNKLEQERSDCRFIYLTHNLDFAASRTNVDKLWMKQYMPPADWKMSALPEDEALPEILYMELLGSRTPILFCEGTKASLDYKLYSRVFQNRTIIPVGGHVQVINYTKAFNKAHTIHGNSAIGIIDGDFHSQEEVNDWKKEFVYCLDVQEVENLLCDEILLRAAQEQYQAPETRIEDAKKKFFDDLERNLDKQALDFAIQKTNDYFKAHLIERQCSPEELKNTLSQTIQNVDRDVDKLISDRKAELQSIIDRRDYEIGIKKYNNKGLLGIVPTCIEKEYKDRVFTLLDSQPELLETFRKKYFSCIPQSVIL